MNATHTAARILMTMAVMAASAPARAEDGPAAALAASRRILVSIPDRKLALIEDDRVTIFRVAVGASVSPSPTGTFTIVNRVTNPTYYKPGTIIAPGASNPIGTRWIGLNEKGYGIHGTDNPASIGFAKSHGCIRLTNADVETLFDRVRTGDLVELIDERTPELEQLFAERR